MTGTDDSEKRVAAEIDQFCKRMFEHCSSIRVIAVIPEPDGSTSIYTNGSGDYYSQLGAVGEWLTREKEKTRLCVQQEEKDDDDTGA